MNRLTDSQIDFVSQDIKRKGLSSNDLHAELFDHICCMLDKRIESGESFKSAYKEIIISFGLGGLRKIQVRRDYELANRVSWHNFLFQWMNIIINVIYIIGSAVFIGLTVLFAYFEGSIFLIGMFLPFAITGIYILKYGIDYKRIDLKYLF